MARHERCRYVQDNLIYLEADEYQPLRIRLHLLFCPNCRKEAARMASLLADMRSFEPVPEDFDMTYCIMRSILALHSNVPIEAKNVSMLKWIAAGLLILFSMVVVRFSKTYIWIKAAYGDYFEAPMYLVFGIILTVYIALFIASHIDELSHFTGFGKDSGAVSHKNR